MSSDVIWHIRDKLWPMPKHGSIRKVYACLAVTCHLHFWQNDRDFLRATVVTRGWNGYRNKSQHRKSTLEKKILPPFQQGFEPATFQSRVRCSNHWAIPAPFFRLCLAIDYNLAQALPFHIMSDDFDLLSKSQVCQKQPNVWVFNVFFVSCVVDTLYGCSRH